MIVIVLLHLLFRNKRTEMDTVLLYYPRKIMTTMRRRRSKAPTSLYVVGLAPSWRQIAERIQCIVLFASMTEKWTSVKNVSLSFRKVSPFNTK